MFSQQETRVIHKKLEESKPVVLDTSVKTRIVGITILFKPLISRRKHNNHARSVRTLSLAEKPLAISLAQFRSFFFHPSPGLAVLLLLLRKQFAIQNKDHLVTKAVCLRLLNEPLIFNCQGVKRQQKIHEILLTSKHFLRPLNCSNSGNPTVQRLFVFSRNKSYFFTISASHWRTRVTMNCWRSSIPTCTAWTISPMHWKHFYRTYMGWTSCKNV